MHKCVVMGVCLFVLTGSGSRALATAFNFQFMMDDPASQLILDGNGGSFGVLSTDDVLTPGVHTLSDLTNLSFTFTLGNEVFTEVYQGGLDTLTLIDITVVDNGGTLEITRFEDNAGSVVQYLSSTGSGQFATGNLEPDNTFLLLDSDQIGLGFFDSENPVPFMGTYTAVEQTLVPEPATAMLGLIGVGAFVARRRVRRGPE